MVHDNATQNGQDKCNGAPNILNPKWFYNHRHEAIYTNAIPTTSHHQHGVHLSSGKSSIVPKCQNQQLTMVCKMPLTGAHWAGLFDWLNCTTTSISFQAVEFACGYKIPKTYKTMSRCRLPVEDGKARNVTSPYSFKRNLLLFRWHLRRPARMEAAFKHACLPAVQWLSHVLTQVSPRQGPNCQNNPAAFYGIAHLFCKNTAAQAPQAQYHHGSHGDARYINLRLIHNFTYLNMMAPQVELKKYQNEVVVNMKLHCM